MADLNALIAQGAQFNAPVDPFAQYAKLQQLQQGQQANMLNQMKMDEYRRGLQEQEGVRNYLRATPNFDPAKAEHQAGLMQVAPTTAPKLIESFLTAKKTSADIGKATAEAESTSFKTRVEKANKAITDISSLSNASEALASINDHLAKGDIDQAKADSLRAQLAQAPDFQTWRKNMVMGILNAKDQLEFAQPKPEKMDLGGKVVMVDMNPNSPTYKQPITTGEKVMTPYEAGHLKVQQGQLANAQARLNAEMATGTLTPETKDFLAETYRKTGQLPPMGMGKGAAKMRQEVLDRAAQLSMSGGKTAEEAAGDVRANKAETAGMTAGQRTVGTQIANVQIAANEANKMIEVAKPYVNKVNPTDYPVLNAAGNFVAKNTGDPNIVGLATALNGLVNTYARAINPKGTATVSDKQHAREIINTAMSKGQINEAFAVMGQEMNAALASGPETRAAMRPGAPKPAAAPAGARPSLDSIFGTK